MSYLLTEIDLRIGYLLTEMEKIDTSADDYKEQTKLISAIYSYRDWKRWIKQPTEPTEPTPTIMSPQEVKSDDDKYKPCPYCKSIWIHACPAKQTYQTQEVKSKEIEELKMGSMRSEIEDKINELIDAVNKLTK